MYARSHAAAHPDQPAIVMATTGDTITFAEFEGRSNRLAHLFRDAGLRRMDHVALLFENNPTMLEVQGAAERTGLYYTCINSYLSAEEVAYVVNDCQARIVVTSDSNREVASQLPALCPNVERWLMTDTADAT